MNANIMNRTIEMTKNEANAAGKLDSDKFNELREYQTAYPTFTIRIVATPKRKSQFTGLDYDFMEKYITKCKKENKNEILEKFNTLRGKIKKDSNVEDEENDISTLVKAEKASYLEVKAWFLKTFPEIENYKKDQLKKIEEILNVA